MQVLIVNFERLPACALGCYGELNYQTPNFDALAQSSLVCDQYFSSSESPTLTQQLQDFSCRTILLPVPSAEVDSHAAARRPGLDIAQEAVPEFLTRHLQDIDSADVVCIEIPVIEPDRAALLAAANAWLQTDLQDFYALLGESESPDRFHKAGALALLPESQQGLVLATAEALECDALLAQVLNVLDNCCLAECLLIVTSANGDLRRGPPGQPDWIRALSDPAVHLPLLVQCVEHPARRTPALLTQADLIALIANWRNGGRSLEELFPRREQPAIRYSCETAHAWRSRDWLLIQQSIIEGSDSPEVRLFRKPEDVWETLDVAAQYPDLVEEFQKRLA
jgi:hypothetical protein